MVFQRQILHLTKLADQYKLIDIFNVIIQFRVLLIILIYYSN